MTIFESALRSHCLRGPTFGLAFLKRPIVGLTGPVLIGLFSGSEWKLKKLPMGRGGIEARAHCLVTRSPSPLIECIGVGMDQISFDLVGSIRPAVDSPLPYGPVSCSGCSWIGWLVVACRCSNYARWE